jgi:tRNA G37 N-methylase TrmD
MLSSVELKPEERVNLAIGMTDACVRICIEGILNRDRSLTEEEVREKVRERIMYARGRVGGDR